MRRARQLFGGVVAVTVTVAVVVGVPAALVNLVGWPLPTSLPALEDMRRAASMGVTEATVIKTLAVVVWLAWSQVTIGIVAECVGLVRRRPVRAWVVLPGAQVLASRLVAGMLLVTATIGPRHAVEARPLEAVIGQVDVPAPPPVVAAPSAPSDAVPATGTAPVSVRVGERGSWWQLADEHLDDGLRWREIRDLNIGRQVAPGVVITKATEQLDAGWSLLVPTEGQPVAAASPTGAAAPALANEHVVVAGEHFWQIAEDTLADAWDRAPTDQETASYWRELIEDNRDRLAPPHDPDIIHPGEVFALPDVPADSEVGPTDEVPAGEPAIGSRPESGSEPADASPPEEPTEKTPARPHADATAEDAGEWASALTNAETAPASPGQEGGRTPWGTPSGLTSGVAATALIGAGLASVLRRRRRAAVERHVAGLRLPTPSPEAQRTEARLAAAAPTPERLTDLAALLASIPSGIAPVLVTTTDDGMVTLLFAEDDELPAPPDPWELARDGEDGPVGWQARIGSRGAVRSIGLPLLVTLGRTGATTVLANVGAMRTLTVRGDDTDVLTCLRRFAMEAAVSPVSGPLEVVVDDSRLVADVPDIRVADDLQAEVDAAFEELETGVVEDDRTVRLLVSCAQAPEVPSELRTVVGALCVTAEGGASWAIDVADGEMRLTLPDGAVVDLDPPDVDLDHVDECLDAATPGRPVPTAFRAPEESAEPPRPGPTSADGWGGPDTPWCDVQVLGRVRVLVGGEELRLSSQQRELLAFLACHRGAEAEQIEDAIWAGQADETGQRLRTALTKLRSTLGDGPDGELLLPRRTGPGQGICLSDHVRTDLDRALDAVSEAWSLDAEERLTVLRAALAPVRGAPFENLPATWTTPLTHTATVRLQDAALKLSRALRESGELDEAERAVHQGLKLCDPSEVLYREWAEVEAARGRPDRIRALESRLRDLLADDTDVGTPAAQLPEQLSALG